MTDDEVRRRFGLTENAARKPSIRKQGGCWQVTRPGYGFNPGSTSRYPSWRAAVASLPAPGSAGPIVEQGMEPQPAPWYRSVRDAKGPVPIRMETP